MNRFKDTLIKILSLGIGLAIGIVLIAKVCFELSYDSFYQDVDRIYLIKAEWVMGDQHNDGNRISGAVAPGFKADFKFMEQQPENIRSGQTYYLNLQLGQPVEAVLIPRGAFYQKTGGKWIYVLSPDGSKATRRDIRIGRQNPQYYEVVEGLEAGERVITSSYDNFGESEVLVF